MGRLVGLSYFLSEEALVEQKADATSIRRMRVDTDDSTEGSSAKDCQIAIAQRMQARFDGRILRRTGDSLDWKKRPLVSLPPYEETMVVVKPTAREMEIISQLADGVKER
jgi:TATA-binding protein-associated factor